MISYTPQQQYRLYSKPTDMRKSFDGLCGIVRNELNRDAVSGEVFLFLNKTRNQIKVLVWDRNGYCGSCKRFEAGVLESKQGIRLVDVWLIFVDILRRL